MLAVYACGAIISAAFYEMSDNMKMSDRVRSCCGD